MTDKQIPNERRLYEYKSVYPEKSIIIDGVDVSGCEYYKTGDCLISPVWCDQFYNCYYKHLQRVDERNKELEDVEAFRLEELATLDDLRDENSKLKKELEQEKALKETYLACYKAKHEDIEGKLFKLKQAITEIKEIAEEQQSWNELNSKHSETESEDDIFAYNWSALKQILQKINEVEDENNRKI